MISKGLMLTSMLVFVLAVSGCGGNGDDTGGGNGGGSSSSADNGDHEDHDDSGHSHADPPHGGTLIEFGGGEYHGEFVHDEESVTIYILNADVSEQVAIDAESITLNVTQDGESTPYELQADPDEGDAEGKSSRFTLTDAALIEAIEAEGTTARAAVEIDGNPYQGSISHDHGHSHD